jgi:hypothetical protein
VYEGVKKYCILGVYEIQQSNVVFPRPIPTWLTIDSTLTSQRWLPSVSPNIVANLWIITSCIMGEKSDFERKGQYSLYIYVHIYGRNLYSWLGWWSMLGRHAIYRPKWYADATQKFYRWKALTACCWGSASFLPWETTARSLRSEGQKPIFHKDQEHMLVSSILKLSACWFGINSDYVSMVSFTFTQ